MKTAFLTSLNRAVNAYLKADPESPRRLKKLAGKTIAVELQPFALTFFCCFNENGVDIKQDVLEEAHAKITGTPLRLLGVMLTRTHRQQFFEEDVVITGNAEIAQEVVTLFDQIQIDWEEHLSRFIGDAPAYHFGKLLNSAGNWFCHADDTLSKNMDEYLHEEAKIAPPIPEVEDFCEDVDQLRMSSDRLEAKIHQLQTELAEEDSQ